MKILFTNKRLVVTCLGSSDTPEKSCFRLALYSNWAGNDQKLLCVRFCFQKLGGDLGLCRFLSLFLWVGIWHTLVIITASALIRTHWTAAGVWRFAQFTNALFQLSKAQPQWQINDHITYQLCNRSQSHQQMQVYQKVFKCTFCVLFWYFAQSKLVW